MKQKLLLTLFTHRQAQCKLLLLCFILFTCAALATTRFVSTTGSSVPPYTTWATASDSIQKAINICNDGDTVIVANGVYKETLAITKRIALLGSSMDSCIIDMTGLTGLLDPNKGIAVRANSTIKNFYIIGKESNYGNTAVHYYLHDSSAISDCRIEQSEAAISVTDVRIKIKNLIIKRSILGIHFGALDYIKKWEVDNVLIISSKEINQWASGVQMVGGGNLILTNSTIIADKQDYGLYISDYQSAVVKNNLIAGFSLDNFLNTTPRATIIVMNNVLLNARRISTGFSYGMTTSAGNRIKFVNNILADNLVALSAYLNLAFTDYNLLWDNNQNFEGPIQLGEHTLFADPMFVKDTIAYSQQGDFHLQKYSPAIDAGDPEVLDVDGSRSDIGLFGGPLGETYTYQDLAPRVPKQLQAVQDSSYIKLTWLPNSEADFYRYILYRDTVSGFSIIKDKAIYIGIDTFFNDLLSSLNAKKYYYKITAIDNQKNQSAASAEISVTITGVGEPVIKNNDYLLYNNYPNPFNPTTKIGFHLKERAYVKLLVYNINGELIEVLVNEEEPAGYHEAEFNASGKYSEELNKKYGSLASGIYLYRIEVHGENNIPIYSDMKKMILLK